MVLNTLNNLEVRTEYSMDWIMSYDNINFRACTSSELAVHMIM